MPELMGKLDTSVNGPDGLSSFDGDAWDRVNWRHQEEQVRRLRGGIFKAVPDGDRPTARNSQKVIVRGWAKTPLSVPPATQPHPRPQTHGTPRPLPPPSH